MYEPVAATSNETIELSEAKQLLAKERQQRGHFIELNQMLVEEIKEKSKMAAGNEFYVFFTLLFGSVKSYKQHARWLIDWF